MGYAYLYRHQITSSIMQLHFVSSRPVSHVFQHLTDAKMFVAAHPVITEMVTIGNDEYRVHETLRVLGIPISFRYVACITVLDKNRAVKMSAIVMRLVRIEIEFNMTTENSKTVITETVNFNSWLPVKPIMGAVFRKQHKKLFERIECMPLVGESTG